HNLGSILNWPIYKLQIKLKKTPIEFNRITDPIAFQLILYLSLHQNDYNLDKFCALNKIDMPILSRLVQIVFSSPLCKQLVSMPLASSDPYLLAITQENAMKFEFTLRIFFSVRLVRYGDADGSVLGRDHWSCVFFTIPTQK
ncbi:hypothetical protein BpHYR1_015430, partial [Brachionus plicatilis]